MINPSGPPIQTLVPGLTLGTVVLEVISVIIHANGTGISIFRLGRGT